jgi:hypothetical protein
VPQRVKPIFSSVHSFLVVILRFARISRSKRSSFISWCDSCAWPSGTWLAFHVAVANAETRHPPPHYANIHCSVGEYHWVQFFPHGGIHLHTFASYSLPCQTPFCYTASLLPSTARQQNVTEYWREVATSIDISPTSASDVVGHQNEIGCINFGATVVFVLE